MGAVFSALFLYGAALTYGATGQTAFGHAALPGRSDLLVLGQSLMVIGLLFKVGAVPFHFWTPDAYTGAPVAVTGFMGAVIKVGGFAALGALWLNLVAITGGGDTAGGPIGLDAALVLSPAALESPYLRKFHLVFLVAAVLSLLLGNFSALKQSSARRMIAYSSIAHTGYLLLAFALPAAGENGAIVQLSALWYYLVAYAIATAGALTAIAALSGREDAADDLAGLAGRGRTHP